MWDVVLLILGGGLLGGTGIWIGVLEGRKRLRAWQDAATSCGLEVGEASSFWRPWLEAQAGRVGVRIETCGDKGQSTRIVIFAPGPPDFKTVRIRPESHLQWGREIEVGDVSFDSTFFIEGPMPLVFALLDEETRRLLLRVSTEGRLEISLGELRAENLSDEKVPSVLPLLFDLAQRFAQPLDIPRRLAENAHQDSAPGVRLQNLLLLIRELPEDPRTAEALRTVCSDPSPEIRLRAAKELGGEGRDVLFKLAEGLADDTVSAEAVSILGQKLSFERTRAILDRARSVRHVQTARICLEALGRSGAAAAVDALAQVMEEEEGVLAAAAAQALGATGSPAAEPSLILALEREQGDLLTLTLQRELADLRVAAARALGRVGSVAAVLPLKEAAERSWLDLELRRATQQAIADIHYRLPGASPGQLSLAGAEMGQLSLAQDGAGQLSFATDPTGQLSRADDHKPENDQPEEA
jgi:HEAT repeat protein